MPALIVVFGLIAFIVLIQLAVRAVHTNRLKALSAQFPDAVVFGAPSDVAFREKVQTLAGSYGLAPHKLGRSARLAVVADSSGVSVWVVGTTALRVLICPATDIEAVRVSKSNAGGFSMPLLTFVVSGAQGVVPLTTFVRDATRVSIEKTRDDAARLLGIEN